MVDYPLTLEILHVQINAQLKRAVKYGWVDCAAALQAMLDNPNILEEFTGWPSNPEIEAYERVKQAKLT